MGAIASMFEAWRGPEPIDPRVRLAITQSPASTCTGRCTRPASSSASTERPSQRSAAVAPEFAETGGHYLDDCREAYPVPNDAALADHPHGVKAWALDPELADRLWRVSDALTAA